MKTTWTKNNNKKELYEKMYPIGTKIQLISMKGEPQMYSGLIGQVAFIDDYPQIHVIWNNGSSLAIDPDVDDFVVV